ncbi:MAG: GtrA family protein [Acidobacteria bacterium]|nr:GtrA family protein [Acidobacteriota bacterium]
MNAPRLVRESLRFGLVGGLATATHVTIFMCLIAVKDTYPMLANLIAWIMAFVVSFLGHYNWTFREASVERGRSALQSMPRFLMVSLLGLALNSLVVALVIDVARWPYGAAAALMATLVPLVTFGASKLWAFA